MCQFANSLHNFVISSSLFCWSKLFEESPAKYKPFSMTFFHRYSIWWRFDAERFFLMRCASLQWTFNWNDRVYVPLFIKLSFIHEGRTDSTILRKIVFVSEMFSTAPVFCKISWCQPIPWRCILISETPPIVCKEALKHSLAGKPHSSVSFSYFLCFQLKYLFELLFFFNVFMPRWILSSVAYLVLQKKMKFLMKKRL